MRIAAMLRVKNEARWIGEVLQSIQPLTRTILVFDDHSTDDTAAIATQAGGYVVRSPFADPKDTDEVRDKNYALDILRRAINPEYVLCIDGDEVLEQGAADKIVPRLRPDTCVYSLPIKYLWNDRQHYRVDGVYGNYAAGGRTSIFSLIGQGAVQFGQHGGDQAKCGLHCGNVPRGLKGTGAWINATLLHLGYMLPEDRIRKYHWYNKKDPNNAYEDGYRHVIIGDLLPPETKASHGGPLKIYAL